jgi:predicted nucleotide-binding protein
MDFYHVIVVFQTTQPQGLPACEVENDLTRERLVEGFITPFNSDQMTWLNGRVIDRSKVDRVYVVRTNDRWESMLSILGNLAGADKEYLEVGPWRFPVERRLLVTEYSTDFTSEFLPARHPSQPDPKKVFVAWNDNQITKRALYSFLFAIGLRPLRETEIFHSVPMVHPSIADTVQAAKNLAPAAIALDVCLAAGAAEVFWRDRLIRVTHPSRSFGARPQDLQLSDSLQVRRELAARLKAAGCDPDLTGDEWLENQFSFAEAAESRPASSDGEAAPRVRLDLAADVHEEPGLRVSDSSALSNQSFESRRVFVVHGHDETAKLAVARYLEKLELEAVILGEQDDQGLTIIEKLARYSDVDYAVVLRTDDDIGASAKEAANLRPRARQNVIMELGYFLGRLGRNKVCVLRKGEVELPSDYLGVMWTPMDENGAWRAKLAKELRSAGIPVDLNRAG